MLTGVHVFRAPVGGGRDTHTHNAVTRMQYTHFSPQYYIINVDINFSAWLGTFTATNSIPIICYMAPVGGHVYGQQLTQSLTHII